MTEKNTPIRTYWTIGFVALSIKVGLPAMDVRYRHVSSPKRTSSVAAVTNVATSPSA
jgi:hypothetical protein